MFEVKIFLASSGELKHEREQIEIFVNRENNRLASENKHIHLVVWEDLIQSFADGGTQKTFNQALLECHIVVVLVYTKLGEFTKEEFEVALNGFKQNQQPKYLYVYFKDADIPREKALDFQSVSHLEELIKNEKQAYCKYKSVDDLKNQLKSQWDKLIRLVLNETSQTPTTDANKPTLTAPISNLDKINNHVKNYSKGDRYLDVNNNIEKIEKILNEKKSVSVVSFHGMGGVGKTTLAVEYANAMLSSGRYDYAVWFGVENGIERNYREFVTEFLIPSDDGKQDISFYKKTFENFVKERPKTLIILDNYVENSFGHYDLLAFVQELKDQDILITSRKQINTFDKIDVTVFANADEALRMFLMSSTRTYDEGEKEQIKEIANTLGLLPLAIEIAAKFLSRNSILKVSNYLQRLKSQTLDTLERAKEEDLPQIHKDKIKATFKVSQEFDVHSKSLELLKIFSLLAPDEIGEEILSLIITDGFDLGEALSELLEYSYIRQNGDKYAMHRLLQEALREELKADTPENIAKVSIGFFDWMKKSFDDGKYEKYFEKYMPHIELLKQISGRNGYEESTVYINTCLSAYICQVSPLKASELSKEVVELSEKTGIDDNRKAVTLMQYAATLRQSAKYDDSLAIHKKALGMLENLTDDNSRRDTASTYHNIGSVYQAKGEYGEALEQYEKSLEINLMVVGETHFGTAVIYNTIGSVYQDEGKYDEALRQYEKSLEIFFATIGESHPYTATTYNNIGSAYRDKGEYCEALEQYEKSLKIYLATIGENHPNTAITYHNMGFVYRDKGEYDKALDEYEKSLKIYFTTIGEYHPYTAVAHHSIGLVYRDKKSYTNAFKAVAKAAEIYLKLEKSPINTRNISEEVAFLNRARNSIANGRPDANQKTSINKQIEALKNLAKQNGYEKLVKIDKLT